MYMFARAHTQQGLNKRLKSFSHKIFVFLLTFSLLLSQYSFFLLKSAHAATNWYSSSWGYRKPITINNIGNTSSLTNYPVQVSVTYDSDMQADFDDIRFANSDGTTLIDHWLESKTDSSSATFWVETPNISGSSQQTIYMYYGNSSASSASDGDNTFDFFDDFRSRTEVEFDDRPFEVDYVPWKDAWKPVTIHYQNTYNRTYLTWINKHGTVFIGYYDHDSGAVSNIEIVGYPSDYIQYPNYAGYPIDVGHALPSMTIDNNGYIYVFYGPHNSPLTYRKSNNPEDITSFSSLQTLSLVQGTYPSPIVTNTNKIIVLYRQDDKDLAYIESSDGGEVWNDPVELIDAGNVDAASYPWIYPEAIILGNESPTQSIHILGSRLTNSSGNLNFEGLYYLKSTDGGSTWKKANNTTVTLPATASTVDVVDTEWGYPANMKLNSSGYPYIVYNQNKTYYFSKWTGSVWSKNLIVAGSATFNIEYLDLDIVDDNTIDVYLVEGTVADTAGGNIQRWRSTDGGSSWSKVEDITSDGDTDTRYEYPHVVRNYNSYLKLFYFKNELTASGGRRLTFKSYPNQIPVFTFTDYLKSGYAQWGKGSNSGYYGIRENQLNVVSSDTNVYKFSTDQTKFSGDIAVHWKMKNDVLVPAWPISHSVGFYPKYFSASNNIAIEERQKPDGTYERKMTNTATGQVFAESLASLGSMNDYEFNIYGENIKVYVNNNLKWEGTIPSSISQTNASVGTYVYSAVDAYYDNIFVRQYTSPEPTTSVGSEESPIATIDLISPNKNYTTNTKPTFSFKKAINNVSPISSYSVTVDSDKNESFSTSGISTSGDGSASSVWRDNANVKVEFFYENDSDSTNDEIRVYLKDLDSNELTEGKHSWRITAYDNASNAIPSSVDFYIDRTSPSISELAIADVSSVSPGGEYKFKITNRIPSFSGKALDSYQGSKKINTDGTKDTFDKVSSGPDKLTLTLKRLKDQEDPNSANPVYENYLTKEYSLADIKDDPNNEKYTRFYITAPYPLADGYYQVNLSLKDKAGNIYEHPAFYLVLEEKEQLIGGLFEQGKLQTEIIEKEKIPAETEEEKERIKEEGYTVKVKVVDINKNPVKGAKVTLFSEPKEALTDEEGIAAFDNVEKGEHKIVIAYKGQTGKQKVNLGGKETKEFDFTIQIKQTNPLASPLVILIVSSLTLIIVGLSVWIYKIRRRGVNQNK